MADHFDFKEQKPDRKSDWFLLLAMAILLAGNGLTIWLVLRS